MNALITHKTHQIYADESVNVAVVDGLKRYGVEAFSARDIGKLDLTDEPQRISSKHILTSHFLECIRFSNLEMKDIPIRSDCTIVLVIHPFSYWYFPIATVPIF